MSISPSAIIQCVQDVKNNGYTVLETGWAVFLIVMAVVGMLTTLTGLIFSLSFAVNCCRSSADRFRKRLNEPYVKRKLADTTKKTKSARDEVSQASLEPEIAAETVVNLGTVEPESTQVPAAPPGPRPDPDLEVVLAEMRHMPAVSIEMANELNALPVGRRAIVQNLKTGELRVVDRSGEVLH